MTSICRINALNRQVQQMRLLKNSKGPPQFIIMWIMWLKKHEHLVIPKKSLSIYGMLQFELVFFFLNTNEWFHMVSFLFISAKILGKLVVSLMENHKLTMNGSFFDFSMGHWIVCSGTIYRTEPYFMGKNRWFSGFDFPLNQSIRGGDFPILSQDFSDAFAKFSMENPDSRG